jgi:hypothetical protein
LLSKSASATGAAADSHVGHPLIKRDCNSASRELDGVGPLSVGVVCGDEDGGETAEREVNSRIRAAYDEDATGIDIFGYTGDGRTDQWGSEEVLKSLIYKFVEF